MPFKSQGGNIRDIFVSETELIERFTGKQLWLWGCGAQGQIGTNTVINQSSPVQTISGGTNWSSVSGGGVHTAAIKTDDTLWLWGYGSRGQLGNNTVTNRSSPVQTISGGTNWRSVSSGFQHTAAIKTDGTLWLWGFGTTGRLGNNAATDQSSPVQTISGGTNWKSVSAGDLHTASIKTDGTLWLWGSGGYGRLGNNAATNQSSPVQTISGGTNWRSISGGGEHTAAIKTDGTLWLWGQGTFGRLGTNNIIGQSSPVQTVSGGTTWKSVSSRGGQNAAIKTDGTLWLWGFATSGQLGDNSTTSKSSPVQTVSGGTNWRSVDVGGYHSVAIKTDGSLWTWGRSGYGQLGDNTITNRSSPVQTISGGTTWRTVSAGCSHTAATCLTEF